MAERPKLEDIVKPDYKLHVKSIHYMGSWKRGYYSVSFDEPDQYTDKTVKASFAALRKAIRAYRHQPWIYSSDDYMELYGGTSTSGSDWRLPFGILLHFEDWMQFTAPLKILIPQAEEEWKRRFAQPMNQSLQVNIAFQTLGLSSDADLEDVKKRYRTLAKQYHPDTGGDEVKFKELNNANQILMQHFS